MKRLGMALILIMSGALVFAGGSGEGEGAKFPQKSLTIVCPYGAGGGTDLVMRIVGEYMGKYLGQPVVVENKTGGVGTIGLLAVLDSRYDGYTMTSATVDLITLPILGMSDRIKADTFEVLGVANGDPAAIIVKADAPWNSLKDFIEDAKKRPGQISLANAGSGNIWHLSALGLEDATGASFNHVPYQEGAASELTGLLGNHVDAACCSVAEASAHIAAGTLKALAIAGEKRLDAYPNIPTYKEQGVDLVVIAARGVCVPADVPAAEKVILKEAFNKAVNDPECKKKILDSNLTYMSLNAEEGVKLFASMKPAFEKAIAIYNKTK